VQGIQGPAGASGLANVKLVYAQPNLPGMTRIAATATCPTGMVAIGGGWFGPMVPGEARIVRDEPCGNSWCVIAESTVTYLSYIRVTAVCVAGTWSN